MKLFGGKKIIGGQATRAEVYGLFLAAIVLIGGGIGGAVALTGGGLEEQTQPTPTLEPTSSSVGANSSPSASSDSGSQGSAPGADGSSTDVEQGSDGAPGGTPSPETEPGSQSQPSRESQFHGAPVDPLPAPRTVIAPDVIGWTYEQVQQWTLENLGRNPAWMDTSCYGGQYAPATVARQSPVPGALIIDDYDPVTTSASGPGIAIWMERDSYVGPNWYSEGRCAY